MAAIEEPIVAYPVSNLSSYFTDNDEYSIQMTLDTSLELVITCNESSCTYKCTLENTDKVKFGDIPTKYDNLDSLYDIIEKIHNGDKDSYVNYEYTKEPNKFQMIISFEIKTDLVDINFGYNIDIKQDNEVNEIEFIKNQNKLLLNKMKYMKRDVSEIVNVMLLSDNDNEVLSLLKELVEIKKLNGYNWVEFVNKTKEIIYMDDIDKYYIDGHSMSFNYYYYYYYEYQLNEIYSLIIKYLNNEIVLSNILIVFDFLRLRNKYGEAKGILYTNKELISILSNKIISSTNIIIIEKIFSIICINSAYFNPKLVSKIISYKSERNLLNLIKYCFSDDKYANDDFKNCIKFLNIEIFNYIKNYEIVSNYLLLLEFNNYNFEYFHKELCIRFFECALSNFKHNFHFTQTIKNYNKSVNNQPERKIISSKIDELTAWWDHIYKD